MTIEAISVLLLILGVLCVDDRLAALLKDQLVQHEADRRTMQPMIEVTGSSIKVFAIRPIMIRQMTKIITG